jgi:hypothetical protein
MRLELFAGLMERSASANSLRHTYAIMRISEGVIFQVVANMGTSVEMIESFYGRLRREFYDYVPFPRAMPHLPVNEEPGSSRMRFSLVRNAFGGQVIGSTARLRRRTLGSGSPVNSIK